MSADFKKVCETIYVFPGIQFDSYTYLIKEDKTFLVDPGTGKFFQELKKALEKINCQVSQLDAVVNTHCHFDHAGADHFFDCPIYAREPDLSHMRAGDEFTLASMFGAEFVPVEAKPIPDDFKGWRVLSSPGHTQGSIALYKETQGKKVLISGDTLFPAGVGRTDLPGGDQSQLEQSLKLLKSLDADFLLSGHGCSGDFL